MRNRPVYLIGLALVLAAGASANVVTYYATVNTGYLSGMNGAVEFQLLNGGGSSLAALADISGFTSDGLLAGSPVDFGGNPITSAVLPLDTVTLDNFTNNDYYDEFSFGTTIGFTVRLSGEALDSPSLSAAGTRFSFFMYRDTIYTPAATLDPEATGREFMLDINPDGTVTTTNYDVGGTPVPEPAGALLVAAPLLGLGLWRLRRRPAR